MLRRSVFIMKFMHQHLESPHGEYISAKGLDILSSFLYRKKKQGGSPARIPDKTAKNRNQHQRSTHRFFKIFKSMQLPHNRCANSIRHRSFNKKAADSAIFHRKRRSVADFLIAGRRRV